MIKRLKSPLFHALGGLSLLFATLYSIGPFLGFQSNNTAKLAGLVTAIMAIFLLISRFSRKASPKEGSSDKGPESKQKDTIPLNSTRRSEVKEEVQAALGQLPSTSRRKGSLSQNSIESLQAFAIIGLPQSGKSSLLKAYSARLTPLRTPGEQQAGTAVCKWHRSDDALFLDTDSQLVAKDPRWSFFLKTLDSKRRTQGLNGLILHISAEQLVTQKEYEQEQVALQLQRQIHQITEDVGSRLPVYITVGKIDLLQGFSSYFSQLDRENRTAQLGFNFDENKATYEHIFDSCQGEMEALVSKLEQGLTHHLMTINELKNKENILALPQEFARCATPLSQMLKIILEPRQGQEQAKLVGVYFTSAAPSNSPIMGLHTKQLNTLGMPAPETCPSSLYGQSYFVHSFLKNLAKHSQKRVQPTQKTLKRSRHIQRLSLGLVAILCFVSSATAARAYYNNSSWLRAIEGHSLATQAPPMTGQAHQLTGQQLHGELELQSKLLKLLEDRKATWATEEVRWHAKTLLQARTQAQLIEPLLPTIQRQLYLESPENTSNALSQNPSSELQTPLIDHNADSFAMGYNALKALYLLGGRACTGCNQQTATNWMANYLIEQWEKETQKPLMEAMGSQVHKDFLRLLSFTLTELKDGSIPMDWLQWQHSQELLSRQHTSEETLLLLSLANADLTRRHRLLENSAFLDPTLPVAFSFEGCKQLFNNPKQGQAWWSCLLDIEEDRIQTFDLTGAYQRSHYRAWQTWLTDLQFQKLDSLDGAVRLLSALGREQGSQLKALFDHIGGHKSELAKSDASSPRQIEDSWLSPLTKLWGYDKASDLQTLKELSLAPICLDVQSPFSQLHLSLDTDAEGPLPTALQNYRQALWQLRQRLKDISGGTATSQRAMALDLVRETTEAKGELSALSDAREAFFYALDDTQISPMDKGLLSEKLENLERQIYDLLLPLAAGALENQWQSDIWEKWDAIRPRNASLTKAYEHCPKALTFLRDDLAAWSKRNLTPFLQNGSLRECVAEELGSRPFPLSPKACTQIYKQMSCARRAQCPEEPEASKDDSLDIIPLRIDSIPSHCQNNREVQYVQVDTGKLVYECTISHGQCQLTTIPSLGMPELRLKLRGAIDRRPQRTLDYQGARSFGELLKLGHRQSDWIYFDSVARSACGKGSLGFKLYVPKAKSAPKTKSKTPDKCLRNIWLPRDLTTNPSP